MLLHWLEIPYRASSERRELLRRVGLLSVCFSEMKRRQCEDLLAAADAVCGPAAQALSGSAGAAPARALARNAEEKAAAQAR